MRRRAWARRAAVLIAVTGVAAGMLAAASTATAKTTLTLGYVTTAEHPYGIALQYFADQVKKQSDGDLEIKLLPSYQGGDNPLLNDVKGGAVDMGSISSAVWDTFGVRSFDALQAPFLITNYGLEQKVIAGPIAQKMLKGASKLGMVGLAIHEGGLRKPFAKQPLTGPSTWRDKKIRAPQSKVLATGIRSLGAEPTPLAVTEVFNALRSGTVDGMEANLGLIVTNKYYEVAKYFTGNVTLWPFPTVLAINKSKFDSLSADQQKVITNAAKGVPNYSIKIFTNPAPNAPNFTKTVCENGVKFVSASKKDSQALLKASNSAYTALNKDAETKAYITQIRALAKKTPPPPAPAPLPAGCAFKGSS